MSPRYALRFWFEWRLGTAFWAANALTSTKFGYGVVAPEALPLTPETIAHVHRLSDWHDQSPNWDYPPDPGLWRQDECDRFNKAVIELFNTVVAELGTAFEVINVQDTLIEDPSLDEYLKDPQHFKRI